MKLKRTVLFVLFVALSAPLPLTAQHVEKAGTLIGMVVTDGQNRPIGRVNELAIDWEAGRVAEVLVDTGGFLTTRQKIIAVPPQSLMIADSGGELRLNGDIANFKNAPEVKTSDASVAEVYKSFQVSPYGPIGNLEPAGKIMGLTARNQWNQRLCKVEDLVVDLPGGRIPDVIVVSLGFLDGNGKLTAVQPQAFLFDFEYNSLILDTTRKELRRAHHFKSSEWRANIGNPINLSAVGNTFRVLHSLTAANSNDTAPAATVTRPNESDMRNDIAITVAIEHKILASDGLSLDARHVQIITRKARVTLRGTADSNAEKKQLGDIAASVVPADHVDNKIEVKLLAMATINLVND